VWFTVEFVEGLQCVWGCGCVYVRGGGGCGVCLGGGRDLKDLHSELVLRANHFVKLWDQVRCPNAKDYRRHEPMYNVCVCV
jgi:hypothetical protein